tara:strand:- start:16566 stop:17426 length:861 start_codon:yes stop_codon:yes gene_type:complete
MTPKAFLVFLHFARQHLEKIDFSVVFKQSSEESAKNYYHHTLYRVANQDKPFEALLEDMKPFVSPKNLKLFQCDGRFWSYVLVDAFQKTHVTKETGDNTAAIQLSRDLKKAKLKSGKNRIPHTTIEEVFKKYLQLLKLTKQHKSVETIHSLFHYLHTLCISQNGKLEQNKVGMLATYFSAALIDALQINIFENQKTQSDKLAQVYQLAQTVNTCLLTSDLFSKAYIPPLAIEQISENQENQSMLNQFAEFNLSKFRATSSESENSDMIVDNVPMEQQDGSKKKLGR